jgi:hypothetical protein
MPRARSRSHQTLPEAGSGHRGESPSAKQVNVRVIPTSQAINESVDLAHEIFNRVFRKVPESVGG